MFPILAWLPTERSFMQECAAWKLSFMVPMRGVAPALPRGTLLPRAGTAATPTHSTLAARSVGKSCRECPAPGEGVTLRNWNRRQHGNGLGNFYCPQDCQLFGFHYFSCIKCTLFLTKMVFPCKQLEKGIDRARAHTGLGMGQPKSRSKPRSPPGNTRQKK